MRPKRYESEAAKMRAYRMRKKGFVLVEKEPVVQTPLGDGDVAKDEIEHEKTAQSPDAETPSDGVEQPQGVEAADSRGSPDEGLVKLTATDAKFEAQQPQYFIYMKEVKKRKCRKCDKSFETRLELNQFCSPKCKTEFLKQFQTFGRAHE